MSTPLPIPPAVEARLIVLASLLSHYAVKSHNEAELARLRKIEASKAEEERKRKVLADIEEDKERRKELEARRKHALAPGMKKNSDQFKGAETGVQRGNEGTVELEDEDMMVKDFKWEDEQ
ncbi:hypothetical protein HDU93_008133 [Gonapodya sp. JEL0774]|nr:hypothetical protein HDU93_008133 [Gonapodya sp. JEL0774]